LKSIVTLVETGATDDANDQGIFRLPLCVGREAGSEEEASVEEEETPGRPERSMHGRIL
jgi:hypothetical protein